MVTVHFWAAEQLWMNVCKFVPVACRPQSQNQAISVWTQKFDITHDLKLIYFKIQSHRVLKGVAGFTLWSSLIVLHLLRVAPKQRYKQKDIRTCLIIFTTWMLCQYHPCDSLWRSECWASQFQRGTRPLCSPTRVYGVVAVITWWKVKLALCLTSRALRQGCYVVGREWSASHPHRFALG
jgi:hypothetical protein